MQTLPRCAGCSARECPLAGRDAGASSRQSRRRSVLPLVATPESLLLPFPVPGHLLSSDNVTPEPPLPSGATLEHLLPPDNATPEPPLPPDDVRLEPPPDCRGAGASPPTGQCDAGACSLRAQRQSLLPLVVTPESLLPSVETPEPLLPSDPLRTTHCRSFFLPVTMYAGASLPVRRRNAGTYSLRRKISSCRTPHRTLLSLDAAPEPALPTHATLESPARAGPDAGASSSRQN